MQETTQRRWWGQQPTRPNCRGGRALLVLILLPCQVALLLAGAVVSATGTSLRSQAAANRLVRSKEPEPPSEPDPKPPAPTKSSDTPGDTYAYTRSDLDPRSPFYVPASLRYSHLGAGPVSGPRSRFEQGVPVPQEGFNGGSESGATPDKIKEWKKGVPPRTANGMPADYAPNPIDPPDYKRVDLSGAEVASASESGITDADLDAGVEWRR